MENKDRKQQLILLKMRLKRSLNAGTLDWKELEKELGLFASLSNAIALDKVLFRVGNDLKENDRISNHYTKR